jgi:hypothetical protein
MLIDYAQANRPASRPPRLTCLPARSDAMIDRRFLFTLVPASCLSLMAGVAQAQRPAVRFDRDIRPVLSDNCFHCHGPDEGQRQAELRLDLKADAFADRDGTAAFRPGDPVGSAAWQRITSDDPDLRMPPPDSSS